MLINVLGSTMTDVWAQAEASTTPAATNGGSESQVVPEQGQESQLFKGRGPSYPSLFNKTHRVGTVRTGVITKVTDVQSRVYSTDGPGDLKYWEDSTKGQKGSKPVTDPVSKVTGRRNEPVMDTHFELDTEYRITAEECEAVGRKPEFVEEDKGKRVFAAGGYDLGVVREALTEAAPKLGLTKTKDLIGKRLTVKRTGQKPNPGGNPSWILEVKFSQP
jgi:hypothetical protein